MGDLPFSGVNARQCRTPTSRWQCPRETMPIWASSWASM